VELLQCVLRGEQRYATQRPHLQTARRICYALGRWVRSSRYAYHQPKQMERHSYSWVTCLSDTMQCVQHISLSLLSIMSSTAVLTRCTHLKLGLITAVTVQWRRTSCLLHPQSKCNRIQSLWTAVSSLMHLQNCQQDAMVIRGSMHLLYCLHSTCRNVFVWKWTECAADSFTTCSCYPALCQQSVIMMHLVHCSVTVHRGISEVKQKLLLWEIFTIVRM